MAPPIETVRLGLYALARLGVYEPLAAAGGSLRDMTRVAGANPRIWVDIFLDNREAIVAALVEHRDVRDAVAGGELVSCREAVTAAECHHASARPPTER